MKTRIVSLLPLAASLFVLTCPITGRAEGLVSGTVGVLQVNNDGTVYFQLTGGPVLCNAESGAIWGILKANRYSYTTDSVKQMHSQLVAAKLAGRSLNFYFVDNSGEDYCNVLNIAFPN